jgi:hypothetical protein
MFIAEIEAALLEHIQYIPQLTYHTRWQRLARAEAPRQFLRRLHHDLMGTVQILVSQHSWRCMWLA